jgi:hypothetical protein
MVRSCSRSLSESRINWEKSRLWSQREMGEVDICTIRGCQVYCVTTGFPLISSCNRRCHKFTPSDSSALMREPETRLMREFSLGLA